MKKLKSIILPMAILAVIIFLPPACVVFDGARWKTNNSLSDLIDEPAEELAEQNRFVWQPIASNTGKLAVILPQAVSAPDGKLPVCVIWSSTAKKEIVLDIARDSNRLDDGRLCFSFSRTGGEYPDGCLLGIIWPGGELLALRIPKTSEMFTEVL